MNSTNNSSNDSSKRHTPAMWFRSLRRTSRVVVVIGVVACVGIVAYAASVLWNSAHQSTNLSKDRYVEVSISGAEASGSVRPGSTVALAPVLTNEGDVNVTALARVTVPLVNGSSAYDFEILSSWTEIDADESSGVFVYGYGSAGELMEVAPGASTDPLTGSFTMESSITGAEFNGMSDVNIGIDGYLVEAEAGTDPGYVWGMIQ